jgi:hypothetical protein
MAHPVQLILVVLSRNPEAVSSPSSNAETENDLSYTVTQYVFMERCLIKHSDYFVFYLVYAVFILDPVFKFLV